MLVKEYNYILFDWDGCLAMTLDIHLDAYKKTFAEFKIYPSDSEITEKVFGDWGGPKKLGIIDLEEFTDKYLRRVNETYSQLELYRNVKDILRKIKSRGKKMALITTSLKEMVLPALENHQLNNFFDIYLYGDDVLKHKPDPEVLNKAMNKLNGNKDQSIIVGDSKSDLGAGLNAGIDSLLFYPEHNRLFYKFETLMEFKPTYIVQTFEEILNIIS